MRLSLTLLVFGSLVGCAGTSGSEVKEINDRLGRMERRLEELATNLAMDHSPSGSASGDGVLRGLVQRPEWVVALLQLADVMAQIKDLQDAGFTDQWRPLQQLQQEKAALITAMGELPPPSGR